MGEVFFCLDTQTKQPLALKTPWLDKDEDAERRERLTTRFLREARLWVALGQHPNVVRCFFLDTIDDRPWLFLEWIEAPNRRGASLRDWIKENGPLDLEQALRVALDICHGLAHAARVHPGLVHRDLKPGNILLAQDMTAKISDFGLARQWDGLHRRQSGGGVGTPAYRPPEQWRQGTVDVRADIYAFGVTIYEALTACRPFEGDDEAALYRAHRHTPAPPLPESVPAEFNALVQRCLEKDPADRYQSIADLIEALGEVIRSTLGREPTAEPLPGVLAAGDHVNRGNSYVRLKLHDDALREYELALELEPEYATALENRGALYWMLERRDEAIADVSRSIRIDPRSSGALYNRAVMLAEAGEMVRAMQDYNRALSLSPGLAVGYFNRGNLLRRMGNYPQALIDFTHAVSRTPEMATAYHNRGLTHLELANYQAALEDFSKAIELSPDLAAAYFNRGVVHQILGHSDDAIEDYSAAIERTPDFRPAWEQRATIHHHLGEWQRALEDYTRAIMMGPEERVDLYYNRGLVLIEMGEYEHAILNYDHAIAVDRHYLPAHLARAHALRLAGRTEEAHLVCSGLLAIGFDSAALHHHLFNLFMDLGDEESAAKALAAAQALEQQAGGASSVWHQAMADGDEAVAQAHVAALEGFHEAATPEAVQQLVERYPFMSEPSFVSAAEQSIKQRQEKAESVSRRRKTADAARLLWLRIYARL